MSYVAITNGLRNEVRAAINTMRNAEAVEAKEPPRPPGGFTGEEPWLRPKLWGALLGTEWERHELLTIQNEGSKSACFRILDLSERFVVSVSFVVQQMPKHVMVDENGSWDYNPDIDVSTQDDPYFAAKAAHTIEQTEISERWTTVQKDVDHFLQGCKSLNEGLKLWPDLARYVPKERLDKVAEKTARATPTKEPSEAVKRLAAMDMSAITTSTVLARMASANTAGSGA